jgi:hypothetical protein
MRANREYPPRTPQRDPDDMQERAYDPSSPRLADQGGRGYGYSESGASSAGPGGQQRGFGRGGYGHARHRGELGEVGRSSVYGQPPGASGPYPGRPVLRETIGELSHQRRGPKGYRRSDARIQEFICERLVRYHWLDVSEVSVAVQDGEVSLEGTVPERRMKHEIEDVAAGCWGVREVHNRIHVLARPGPEQTEPGMSPGEWPGSARPAAAEFMQALDRDSPAAAPAPSAGPEQEG